MFYSTLYVVTITTYEVLELRFNVYKHHSIKLIVKMKQQLI